MPLRNLHFKRDGMYYFFVGSCFFIRLRFCLWTWEIYGNLIRGLFVYLHVLVDSLCDGKILIYL
jgi:hypothetical protein